MFHGSAKWAAPAIASAFHCARSAASGSVPSPAKSTHSRPPSRPAGEAGEGKARPVVQGSSFRTNVALRAEACVSAVAPSIAVAAPLSRPSTVAAPSSRPSTASQPEVSSAGEVAKAPQTARGWVSQVPTERESDPVWNVLRRRHATEYADGFRRCADAASGDLRHQRFGGQFGALQTTAGSSESKAAPKARKASALDPWDDMNDVCAWGVDDAAAATSIDHV